VVRARRVVDEAVARHEVVYGVTTGFGNFADVVIPVARLRELQLNLVRSHAAGVGDPLTLPQTRALMLLRANVLAKGFSGVRPETLDLLVALINAGVHPLVPSQGSVGASGDLAPLAHLALALVGEGHCRHGETVRPSAEALAAAGLRPVVLEAKEGLALINGTQLMTAIAGLALAEAWRLARTADVTGALTLDALKGTDVAFDPRIHAARPHPGQAASARNLRKLLAGSPIRESHRDCGKVQDAYTLRCMPQVHGAVRDALDFATRTVTIEINAATDNPMVFAESGELLSGGNFHGEPGRYGGRPARHRRGGAGRHQRAADGASGQPRAVWPARLPHARGRDPVRAHDRARHRRRAGLREQGAGPSASVDSIPTSANKEDHVSMGVTAAAKAARAVANTRRILAIEAIAACQALEFLRPLETSARLRAAYARVRAPFPPTTRTGSSPPKSRRWPPS
jgi:histidine ammonia-lyase